MEDSLQASGLSFVEGREHFLTGETTFGLTKTELSFGKEDKETFVETDLVSRQTDTFGIGGFLEDFSHFLDLLGGFCPRKLPL